MPLNAHGILGLQAGEDVKPGDRSCGTHGTYVAKALLSTKVSSLYFSSKRMPPVPSGTGTGGSGAW